MGTLTGEKVSQIPFAFWKKIYSKRKEFAPIGSKFFPFRVDLFQKGVWCAVKQTGSHKSCLPCIKEGVGWAGEFPSVSNRFNQCLSLGLFRRRQIDENFSYFFQETAFDISCKLSPLAFFFLIFPGNKIWYHAISFQWKKTGFPLETICLKC